MDHFVFVTVAKAVTTRTEVQVVLVVDVEELLEDVEVTVGTGVGTTVFEAPGLVRLKEKLGFGGLELTCSVLRSCSRMSE